MKNRTHAWVSWLLIVMGAGLLNACGGGGDSSQAARSDVKIEGSRAGATPFISFLSLKGKSLAQVSSIKFTIQPKTGAVSKAVEVKYPVAVLKQRGYFSLADEMQVPVFGLYAGYLNRVSLELQFNDDSVRGLASEVLAAAYSDPSGIYDRPVVRKQRTMTSGALGFDYFFIKSGLGAPVIIDTDGEIRWTAVGVPSGMASAFHENGFVVGDLTSTKIRRVELDGTLSELSVDSSTYTNFHHNIDPGKLGLLVEMDAFIDGVPSIESIVAEISGSGKVIKEWDFAALLGAYMRSQGDDPAAFIRPGVDWFHMNAVAYDPRDDSLIVSSRENFVVKVDYSSGNIKWILGDQSKYWYSFPSLRAKALRLESGGLAPIGQHAVSVTSDGLLLLFNNGRSSFNQPAGKPVGEDRTYSAVSAYAIDPVALTAREAWRFDYDQTILSIVCSSVYEAPGKTLLVDYAVADNLTKTRLVGLDAGRNVVFDFEYPTTPCNTGWNAQPIALERLSF